MQGVNVKISIDMGCRFCFFVVMLFVSCGLWGQQGGEGFNSIIRNDVRVFTVKSKASGTYSVSRQIDIINDKGASSGVFVAYTNSFIELAKFSATVTSGGKSKKYGMKDLYVSNFSEHLKSDLYINVFEPPATTPYSVKYEYEIHYKNGYNDFPLYAPVQEYNEKLVNSEYRISVPLDYEIDWLASNVGEPAVEKGEKNILYTWNIAEFAPLKQEQYAPPFRDLAPAVYAKPKYFSYGGYDGCQTNWEELGIWHSKLNEGLDSVSVELEQKVKAMTDTCTSDYSKAEVLYNYLGKNTRYVSIQLGIGGYKPIAAMSTDKSKFGDCKGLSLYLQALLKAAGINSYFTIVYSGSRKELPEDYACSTLMNHAILKVELPQRDLWLECTAADHYPFGYVHQSIAGHDVLVVKEGKGVFERIPDYPDSLNVVSENVMLSVDETGAVQGQSRIRLECVEAENVWNETVSNEELVKMIGETVDFSVSKIEVIGKKFEKYIEESFIGAEFKYNFSSTTYAKATANRIFLPVNRFSSVPVLRNASKRVNDIYISEARNTRDTITVAIPQGYRCESMPAGKMISTKFGNCSLSIDLMEENKLVIVWDFSLFKGVYGKELCGEFNAFLKEAKQLNQSQIVFVK